MTVGEHRGSSGKGQAVISSSRWRGFVVAAVASALACVLAVAVGPSFSKNDKGDPGAPAVVEEQSAEAPEEGTAAPEVAEESVAEAADAKAAPPSSNGNSDDKAAEGNDKHGFDPDPPGQNTPPATTGPTSCE